MILGHLEEVRSLHHFLSPQAPQSTHLIRDAVSEVHTENEALISREAYEMAG